MLATSLDRAARLHGQAPAFHDDDETLGWAMVRDRAAGLAGGLATMGITRGERVAALLPNGLALVELFAAGAWAGQVVVPCNTRWTAAELAEALRDCGARALVVDATFRDTGAEAADLAGVALIDATDRYAALLADPLPAVDSRADDLLAIFYTSGTTGRPKGVMLSHGNVGYNALACMAEGLFGADVTYMHASPAFHIAGALGIYAAFIAGSRNVMLSRFDAGLVLATIARHRVTQTLLVPTMIGMVLDHPDFARTDTGSVTQIAYGAAPIAESLLDRAMAAFPQAAFTQLYGMTETAPTSCVLHSAAFAQVRARVRSVGRPISGTDVTIVDARGNPLPPGEVGEIVVRGPGVMTGYWNRAEATREVLRDGAMHTGDGGWMDADGFVYLADRIKDMIITGGENVYSIEVENAVMQIPAIRQCAVIGVPHERWGEAVHAIVVPHEGASIDAADVIAVTRRHLAPFKVPKSVTIRAEPLPLSPAGKVLKRDLRAAFRSD
jgi:long-chain acyl-CoA synthetase